MSYHIHVYMYHKTLLRMKKICKFHGNTNIIFTTSGHKPGSQLWSQAHVMIKLALDIQPFLIAKIFSLIHERLSFELQLHAYITVHVWVHNAGKWPEYLSHFKYMYNKNVCTCILRETLVILLKHTCTCTCKVHIKLVVRGTDLYLYMYVHDSLNHLTVILRKHVM